MLQIKQVQTDKEIAVVATLAKTIWEEHYLSMISQKQITYMLEKFQSILAIKEQIIEGYQYYLFEYQGESAGYMAIVPEENTVFLSKLYVKKEYRGLGISKQGIEYIIKECIEKQLESVYLTCNKYNEGTLKAYQHLGFNVIREQVSDIGNNYIMDDYVLERKI